MDNISDDDLNKIMKEVEEQEEHKKEFPGMLEIENIIRKYNYSAIISLCKHSDVLDDSVLLTKIAISSQIPKTEDDRSEVIQILLDAIDNYLGFNEEEE